MESPRTPLVAFFTWTAALGKILTADNLRKRGVIVMEWFYMCKSNVESIEHLFLHCEVARELWVDIFSRARLSWVMPKSVVDLLACWNRKHPCPQLVVTWRMVPLCLSWCIWMECNERCFNNKERIVGALWKFFVFS